MAVITASQLARLRQKMSTDTAVQDWDKLIINAALQAIEDWFEANRADLGTAIDAATTPYVFSNPRKKKLVKFWLQGKFDRGG